MKAATRNATYWYEVLDISIHAAREGGDLVLLQHTICQYIFQSTPPVKAATSFFDDMQPEFPFQSTPPVKAATKIFNFRYPIYDISIHAAREGGDLCACYCCGYAAISIHAAREGGDDVDYIDKLTHTLFQSTPPVKAATKNGIQTGGECGISIHAAREGGDMFQIHNRRKNMISIHAAREGGDCVYVKVGECIRYFNPRRP